MKLTPFLCGLLMTGAPVIAETYDVTGTGMGTLKSEVMQVGEDLTVVHAMTDYTGFESDNPDNPLASMSGPCFGAVTVKAGQASGAGNCHYTDADGDTAVMQWTAQSVSAEGRTMGSWTVVGGTGKWAGASGGGTFDAGADSSGTYTNNVTGEMTLP